MAGANKTGHQLQRGYPREIFTSATVDDKYLCNFCTLVLRDPVQAFCGHRFCKSCIAENISSGDQIKCTQCEAEDQDSEEFSIIDKDQIFPDNAIKREMSKLPVSCPNSGCAWKGNFKKYEEHHMICEYRQIVCPHCEKEVSTIHYEEHETTLCQVTCGQCGQIVLYNYMKDHVDQNCSKGVVTCDQCEKQGITREMFLTHQQSAECQAHQILCPVGCGPIERRDFPDHFQKKRHISWLVQEMEVVRNKTTELQNNSGAVDTLSQQIQQKTKQIDERIAVLERQLTEVILHQSDGGAVPGQHGVGNIDSKIRQAMEMQLQLINERLDVKTGTFEGIASSLHRELEKTIAAVEKMERHRREMEITVESNQNKIRSLERSVAVKDMTMAELELKSQSMEAASYDGSFMWRIADFNKKHQDAIHGRTISIYSPPFYTSRRGYKMCARLYPNGDGMGKGSHLSLFFVVMKGDYDPLLKWPFSQRVTFCMINQNGGEHVIDSFRPDPQSSSFKRPTSDMNIASGCPLFIRLEMMMNINNGFVKDDTLFLKIAVDTSEISDPLTNLEERIKPQS